MRRRRKPSVIVLLVSVLLTLLLTYYYGEEKTPAISFPDQPDNLSCSMKDVCVTRASRIIDGDTIEIETGEKVRYIGVDTPETVHPQKKVECFGKEASAKNQELVNGMALRLEKDISDKDKFGRLLRYVYIEDMLINERLIKDGYGFAVSYPPDVRFQDVLKNAEHEARANKNGLWADGACGGTQ